MYHFLGISMGFSPLFHMDDDIIFINAPFQMSIHGSCPRCSQTPILDLSVDDDEDQTPEQVQALPRRFERPQLRWDPSHGRIHWKCSYSTTPHDKGKRRVGGWYSDFKNFSCQISHYYHSSSCANCCTHLSFKWLNATLFIIIKLTLKLNIKKGMTWAYFIFI